MKVWITNVDRRNIFATINPLWAACILRGLIPEKVILITDKNLEQETKAIRMWLDQIIRSQGINPIFEENTFDEMDINSYSDSFVKLVEKENENEISIDITPGRQFMAAIMMQAGIKKKISHVFYLHLKDYSFSEQPFVMIPLSYQELKNIIELKEKTK